MIKNTLYTLLVIVFSTLIAIYLFQPALLSDYLNVKAQQEAHEVHADHSGHTDHGGHEEEEHPKGPHRGRLLQQGDFAVEITIFEQGVDPEFHVYSYQHGKLVAPEKVSLQIRLDRLDGQQDSFTFQPREDYLRGAGVVTEPHSFDVSVHASFEGKDYHWDYENYEGRVQINQQIAQQTGIKTALAGPHLIREMLDLNGRVQADPNRLSHVRARFPGMVKSVNKQLGERVRKGEVLAVIQSNESLQNYQVRAAISGLIVRRDVQVGETTADASLFTISDLSRVWVELDVFDRDLDRVTTGQAVQIETLSGEKLAGEIAWLSPLVAHASQSIQARVVVDNRDYRLRPGQFIRGRVTLAEHEVALAVRRSGIQGFRDFKVVFAHVAGTYEVRMLELGRRDQDWVEVLAGLKPGTEYVTENSYLIKADIEKSGASHDH